MEILRVLKEKAALNGLQFLVIGGHAVNVYGYQRTTGDLDLVVPAEDLGKWEEILGGLGYKVFHAQKAFAQFSPPQMTAWPLDLMLVSHETFDKLYSQSEEHLFRDVIARVPNIKHLIAMKLNALKDARPSRGLKDFDDVLHLCGIAGLSVDSDEFRRLCTKFATIKVYEEFLRLQKQFCC